MNKGIQSAEKRIESFKNAENKSLTCHEAVLLANAAIKLESYTLSNVYKRITQSEMSQVKASMSVLFPKGNVPDFKSFMRAAGALYSDRKNWSVFYGLRVMKSLSSVAQTEKKLAKQGGKVVTSTDAVRQAARNAKTTKKAATTK